MMNRKQLFVTVIILLVGLSGVLVSACSESGPEGTVSFQNITPSEASALISENEGNESFVILDVRTSAEYASGHLRDAINIDVESGHFKEDITGLDKDNTYLVYCRSGRRSADASEIMINQGFSNVYNMTSGINEWKSGGFPVVQ